MFGKKKKTSKTSSTTRKTKTTTSKKRSTSKSAAKTARSRAKTTTAAVPARPNNVAQHYTVWDGTRGGKTFATSNEAVAYSNDIMRKSGEIVAVTLTNKQVTHTFKR